MRRNRAGFFQADPTRPGAGPMNWLENKVSPQPFFLFTVSSSATT
jgi:hypothetical protein